MQGQSEKQMSTVFRLARENAPAVLFFDEIDALATSRGKLENDAAARRLLTQWLVEMNEIQKEAAPTTQGDH